MIALLCAVLFALPASAGAPASAPAETGAVRPALGTSTHTVSSLYTGDRVRDPFLAASMGGGARKTATEDGVEDKGLVDIHSLILRGIMRDATLDFAVFSTDTGSTYLLRGRRLYDERNKPVPGISGRIRAKQKSVELVNVDKDVQVFRLGESEADAEKDKEKR